MGNARATTKNLEVMQIDIDKDLLLIKGSIPGAPGGDVMVRPTNPSEVNIPTKSEAAKNSEVKSTAEAAITKKKVVSKKKTKSKEQT
jgi:hypothetical protein